MKPKNLVLECPETQPVCTDISGKTCGVMGSPVQRVSFYKYQELKQCFTLQSWLLVFIMFATQRSPHGSMKWLFSVFSSFALWQLHLYYLFLFKIFTYWLCWDIVAALLCKGWGILSDLFIWIFAYWIKIAIRFNTDASFAVINTVILQSYIAKLKLLCSFRSFTKKYKLEQPFHIWQIQLMELLVRGAELGFSVWGFCLFAPNMKHSCLWLNTVNKLQCENKLWNPPIRNNWQMLNERRWLN